MIVKIRDNDPIQWSFEEIAGEPGKFMIKTEQPTEDIILQHNKDLQNSGYQGNFQFGRHLASIPKITWNAWCKDNPELIMGKQHPDYEKVLMKLIKENPEVLVESETFGQSDNKKYVM